MADEETVEIPDIFSPAVVGAELIAAMKELAARYTQKSIDQYNSRYDQVELNWTQQKYKMPMPTPPVEFYVTDEDGVVELKSKAIPGYPKPAPWANLNPPETPEGFGPPVPGVPGAFWVIGFVPAGAEVTRNGVRYRCIQIPLMQYWFPVG